MRRGRGGVKSIGWSLAVSATWACSSTVQFQPEPTIPVTACALVDAPSIGVDTATITFEAPAATREQCALLLAAERLRPWPSVSHGPWTVHITVGPTDARVRLLDTDAARDAIDAGVALMATDDLELTAYAAARTDLDVTPLPWDRTYVRLPGVSMPLGITAGPDAVHTDARLAEAAPCEFSVTDEASVPTGSASKRVVYDGGDRTARELAERIVAVLEIADATAVGLSAAELDVALRAGSELAYVVSVPRASYCHALATLVQRGPWTTSQSVLPLIDTRAHGIAPRAPRP